MMFSLMIIHDLHFVGATLGPYETDAPLLVDPDAVLSLSVTSKQLQAITGNCLQVRQRGRAVNHLKFSHRCPLEALKAQHPPAVKQRFRVL